MMAGSGYSLGIDIGGTFTDVICCGPDGELAFKIPTTRGDPSVAIRTALAQLASEHGVPSAAITHFAHGTTVATNAVIERRGARLGLIATEGFGDTLEIGRQMRHQLYELALKPETPGWLAPGARRAEVVERIAADGSVVTPLDEDSLTRAIERIAAHDVDAVAVCLLFAFANPAHEIRVRERLTEMLPGIPVSLSHEVDPAFREYERTIATAFDAYVKPTVDTYLGRLQARFEEAGSAAKVQVMQSRGGLSGVVTARQRPVRLFLSGPAAGVVGAAEVGRLVGKSDLLSIDIGGTSSDISMIRNGEWSVVNEADVGGYKIRVPMLDIVTLGAGGGSIAWLDAAGGLRVGPHSAGSEPGPACYGRGGESATVTDASVVLGYLDPTYFAGGTLALDPDLAFRTIERTIAGPMGLSVEEAAAGIHRIANAHMADGIRLVSLKRGYDPRDFSLVALGGGGGVHATAVADELGITSVIIPLKPGVLSAAGLLSAATEHEIAQACNVTLADADVAELRKVADGLHKRAEALIASDGLDPSTAERLVFADLAYVGQSHTLEVPMAMDQDDVLDRAYADFETEHERINGLATRAPGKLVNLRVVHRVSADRSRDQARLGSQEEVPVMPSAPKMRQILFDGTKGVEAPVVMRSALAPDAAINGPAIIEQPDTTTLIPPGWRAETHRSGVVIVTKVEQP